MIFRTDLALEAQESLEGMPNGVEVNEEKRGKCQVTRIRVRTGEAAQKLDKAIGTYVTLEMPPISDHIDGRDEYLLLAAEELRALLPKEGLVLAAGLGNRDITPDALGPLAAEQMLATRHIQGELARVTGLEGLRPVAIAAPGVLGNTGFEAAELLRALVAELKPAALVVIDALASRSLRRLGCTVQLADGGISPGAGVNNARPLISLDTMGVPVISMGVPTVVDAATLAADLLGGDEADSWKIREQIAPRGAQMVVTPREVDLLIGRAARLLAMAVNVALNPSLTVEEFDSLVAK